MADIKWNTKGEEPNQVSRRMFGRLLAVFIAFSVPIVTFAVLANDVRERERIPGDARVLSWVHSLASPLLDRLALVATMLGEPIVVVAVTLLGAGYLLYLRRKRAMTLLLFGVGGAALINVVIKALLQRPRPTLWAPLVTETGYSFPSGHAMTSCALAASVVVLLWPTKWRWLALAIGAVYTLAVGISRSYLGVHYPTDVVAGWCVSFVWVLLVKLTLGRVEVPKKWLAKLPL
jgi:membrane-associated phospholipid phosphatase